MVKPVDSGGSTRLLEIGAPTAKRADVLGAVESGALAQEALNRAPVIEFDGAEAEW